MAVTKKKTDGDVIRAIETRTISCCIRGTSGMLMHRFSNKARQELLYPSQKKNRKEKETSLKHHPLEEFRECLYKNSNPKSPALFHIPGGMFQRAIAAAALDIPGATKSQISRLTSIADVNIECFGIPFLKADMVRSSDIARTPDVRIRPFFQRWACKVGITYVMNPLTDSQILNLLGAAGIIVGIGDWRPQKGGPYGKFVVVGPNDHEFLDIVKSEGRAVQQAAFDNPTEYDAETEELISWYHAEVARRRQNLGNESMELDETLEEAA